MQRIAIVDPSESSRESLRTLLLGVLGLGGCGAEGTSVSVSTSGSCAVRGDTVGLSLLYQQMVSFNQAQPGLMLSVCRIRLPGHADDLPISLTYRPRDQKLYLLGMQGNLYQLNQQTAEGTWVSQLKADPGDSTDPYVALPASSAAQAAAKAAPCCAGGRAASCAQCAGLKYVAATAGQSAGGVSGVRSTPTAPARSASTATPWP